MFSQSARHFYSAWIRNSRLPALSILCLVLGLIQPTPVASARPIDATDSPTTATSTLQSASKLAASQHNQSWSVARDNASHVADMIAFQRLTARTNRLLAAQAKAKRRAAAHTARVRKAQLAITTATTYLVKPNDTTSVLATKAKTTIKRLMCINNARVMPDPNHIYAGTVIRLHSQMKHCIARTTATVSSKVENTSYATSTPPSSASGPIATIIGYAKSKVGAWYRWGAAGPQNFDCSGLTMMSYRQIGVSLPHQSAQQYQYGKLHGSVIARSQVQQGDLVFYASSGRIHHVTLAASNSMMYEAPHPGAQVRLGPIYSSGYFGAVRLVSSHTTVHPTQQSDHVSTAGTTPAAWLSNPATHIRPTDRGYAKYIIDHENGSWNPLRYNLSGSGAYGLPQALPGSKMASAGADWKTNPITQLRWANSYAISRYGSWHNAYAHWTAHHSW